VGTYVAAYIAKSGTIIAAAIPGSVAESAGGFTPGVAAAGFACGMGGLLSVGGVKLADKMNQGLTLILLGLFGVLLVGGAARADWSAADWSGDWTAAPVTVPVVFLALVYHDLGPVICSYLAGDLEKIRRAIVLGSSAPLFMFLSWDAVALGIVEAGASAQGVQGSFSGGVGSRGDPLTVAMQSGDGLVTAVVGGFSFCAIATSFIGTSIGLSEFVQPQLEKWAGEVRLLPRAMLWRRAIMPRRGGALSGGAKLSSRGASSTIASVGTSSTCSSSSPLSLSGTSGISRTVSTAKRVAVRRRLLSRGATYVSILALPVAVAVTNPDAFLPATNFAGAYGMTTMFGILPPVMAISMRGQVAGVDARAAARAAAAAQAGGGTAAAGKSATNASANTSSAQKVGAGGATAGGGDFLSHMELGWLQSSRPRLISPGVPGGTPALAALCFSAFAITLGQLQIDLHRGLEAAGAGVVGASAEIHDVTAAVAAGEGLSGEPHPMLASFTPSDEVAFSAAAELVGAVGADAWNAAMRLFM
jgi:hypothetical protein